MIMSRQNNITSTRKNNDNYNNTILDNNNDNVNKKTKVLYGTQSSTKALVEFVSRAKQKIDSVIDSKAPSVIIEVESIRKERFAAAKDRRIKLRYITEITKDNLSYCKEMLSPDNILYSQCILYSRVYRNNTISKSISRRRWCQHQETN
jgi:hypothetical protein